MRFVRVEAVVEDGWHKGYSLDPDKYLGQLLKIQADLPEGARGFALDEGHYDFFGRRCIKDLKVAQVNLADRNDSVSLEIKFAPNEFKHDHGLVLGYVNVVEFSMSVASVPGTQYVWPETRRLGDVQLDEILPHERGCSHEIQMTGGSLWIVAEDLSFEWG